MQDEAAIELDRAAEIDRRLGHLPGIELDVDLFEQARQIHVDRPVDDDPKRTAFVVLADVDQRIGEIGIFQRRHGDQEIVGQIDAIHD